MHAGDSNAGRDSSYGRDNNDDGGDDEEADDCDDDLSRSGNGEHLPVAESAPSLLREQRVAHTSTDGTTSILLWQDPAKGIPYQVWPASIALCRFLDAGRIQVDGKGLLELGAGTGLVGLYYAVRARPAVVHVTDLDTVVPFMQSNASLACTAAGTVRVWGLDWTQPLAPHCPLLDRGLPAIDYLLCADVCYWEWLQEPLLDTWIRVTDLFPDAVIVMAHLTRRRKVEGRFLKMARKHFSTVLVHLEPVDDEAFRTKTYDGSRQRKARSVKIFEFRRCRKKSDPNTA